MYCKIATHIAMTVGLVWKTLLWFFELFFYLLFLLWFLSKSRGTLLIQMKCKKEKEKKQKQNKTLFTCIISILFPIPQVGLLTNKKSIINCCLFVCFFYYYCCWSIKYFNFKFSFCFNFVFFIFCKTFVRNYTITKWLHQTKYTNNIQISELWMQFFVFLKLRVFQMYLSVWECY